MGDGRALRLSRVARSELIDDLRAEAGLSQREVPWAPTSCGKTRSFKSE